MRRGFFEPHMSLDQTNDARNLIFYMKGHMKGHLMMLLRASEAIFKLRPRSRDIAKIFYNFWTPTLKPQYLPISQLLGWNSKIASVARNNVTIWPFMQKIRLLLSLVWSSDMCGSKKPLLIFYSEDFCMVIFNLRKKDWLDAKSQICFPGSKFAFPRT